MFAFQRFRTTRASLSRVLGARQYLFRESSITFTVGRLSSKRVIAGTYTLVITSSEGDPKARLARASGVRRPSRFLVSAPVSALRLFFIFPGCRVEVTCAKWPSVFSKAILRRQWWRIGLQQAFALPRRRGITGAAKLVAQTRRAGVSLRSVRNGKTCIR